MLEETFAAAFAGEGGWERDPAFRFYMAVYEERWGREPGSLVGPDEPAFAHFHVDVLDDDASAHAN